LSIYRSVFGGDPGPTLVISVFPLSLTMGALGYLYDKGIHLPVQYDLRTNSLNSLYVSVFRTGAYGFWGTFVRPKIER
jgi:hypothetical protein